MKNTDIALVVMVATVSVVASYFIGNAVMGDPGERVEKISYIDSIDGSVLKPDSEDYNWSMINPTVEIYVGNCGPLEDWDEGRHICVSKYVDEDDDEKNADEDEDSEDDGSGSDSENGDNGASSETGDQ